MFDDIISQIPVPANFSGENGEKLNKPYRKCRNISPNGLVEAMEQLLVFNQSLIKTINFMKMIWNKSAIKALQVFNWMFFVMMIAANYLANALPFNNKTTGQLSAQYPNLFVPAPITFAIWGIIYISLLFFCIKQSKSLFKSHVDEATADTVGTIGSRFIVTCILNILWMLSWHYEYLIFSVFVMLALLVQLININARLNAIVPYLNKTSRTAIKIPFGSYLGWICIATIANITAALVGTNWEGWGQSQTFWATIMILVGTIISSWALLKLKNAYIGLSVIWALTGIIIARLEADLYYRFIVWSAVFGIVLIATAMIVEITGSLFRTSKIKVLDSKLDHNHKAAVL